MENGNILPDDELYDFDIDVMAAGGEEKPAIKIANIVNPKVFHGRSSENVVDWIDRYEVVAVANGWRTDVEKLNRLPAYLDSTALKWYLALKDKPTSWTAFKEEIIAAFAPINSKISLFEKLQRRMVLGESLEDYFYEKLQSCLKFNPEMPEKEKCSIIMNGLTPFLLDRVYQLQPETVGELMIKLKLIHEGSDLANTRTDVALNMLSGRGGGAGFRPQNEPPQGFGRSGFGRGGFYQARPKTSMIKQLGRMPETRTCFNCGKKGHIKPNCRHQGFAPRNYKPTEHARTRQAIPFRPNLKALTFPKND